MQSCGIQIYQNSVNPYAVSTFYQRNLFDDSYIQEDTFLNYSKEFKQKVGELVLKIGQHNLESLSPNNKFKSKFLLAVSMLSRKVYNCFPYLEKNIIGKLYGTRKGKRSKVEENRDLKRRITKHH